MQLKTANTIAKRHSLSAGFVPSAIEADWKAVNIVKTHVVVVTVVER